VSEALTGAPPTTAAAAPAARATWRWSTWSLTRKLPVITAAVVVLVLGTSLALTYRALTAARMEAVHDRLLHVTQQLAQTSDQTVRTRVALYRQAAGSDSVLAAVRAAASRATPADGTPAVHAAVEVLRRLRAAPDSSLPIELWTIDGRRIAHIGVDVPNDPHAVQHPELRAQSAPASPDVASRRTGLDSVRYGPLYAASGKVLYWTVVPVIDGGRRTGYIAQQRLIRATRQSERTVRELIGDDAALYLHNVDDRFWTSYRGVPTTPLAGIDTAAGDFIGWRDGVGDVTAYEGRIAGTPWAITLEAPLAAVLAEPRATLRRLMLVSLVLVAAGVVAAWVASRRIARPIESLASLSEAIARGDYATRVPDSSGRPTRDEVARLAASFNRMAGEIEGSHRALERQVAEALAVSQELEHTNQELQRLSADAEEARDAAQHANRAKSDFLAVMSHELRTPLNAIGGYTDILRLGIYGAVTDEQRNALERIMRSQQMLLSLINDVLNFAKLDAGQVQYRMEDVPLHEALASLDTLVAPQMAAKALAYRYEGCAAAARVRADREKLQQIVLNLLSNAVKFTPARGTITLSCRVEGELAAISVADTGIGIPADRLDAIFDPFVQVDRTLNRVHDGIGLGLSISRDLATGMGGTLTVCSSPEAGSTFTLHLRRAG
jgi:signal transduction histidine kinase